MHHYPEDQSTAGINKIRRENSCSQCGRELSAYLDRETHRTYIACSGQLHEGITREYKPLAENYQIKIRREHEMEQKGIATQETNALIAQGIPMTGIITKD